MIRLYISTARQPITPSILADILRASRRNNAPVAVTGLLIVGGRRFLQALEGPEAAVEATYERIARDRAISPSCNWRETRSRRANSLNGRWGRKPARRSAMPRRCRISSPG